MTRLRITQTLLSAWDWCYKKDEGYDEFVRTLNRIKTPPTKAMLEGQRFEGMVNACMDGYMPPYDSELREQVIWCADYLKGAEKQVTLFKEIEVDNYPFLLHGVLDFLREGIIYDTKFSQSYKRYGKYLDSPQHPMYFALCPEAKRFEYVICDGKYVYREGYTSEDVEPIEQKIALFIAFLKRYNLWEIYKEKWWVKG